MKTIVIHGPQGCGKTTNAEVLMMYHGCARVQDDWDGEAPLQPGTLALTNREPPYAVDVDLVIRFAGETIHGRRA